MNTNVVYQSVNQSVFYYVSSHRGDIRHTQKHHHEYHCSLSVNQINQSMFYFMSVHIEVILNTKSIITFSIMRQAMILITDQNHAFQPGVEL